MGENKIEKVIVEDNKNIVDLEDEKVIYGSHKFFLETFINDIGEDIKNGSFIVGNKGFENSRNNEIGKTYPGLEYPFALINENAIVLMDIFKKGFYFDLNFQGSNSIKHVLPVLVPEMSYDGMEVPNGAVAMKLLDDIISGEIKEKEDLIKNLLLYCGQDNLAMYKIFEKIKSS